MSDERRLNDLGISKERSVRRKGSLVILEIPCDNEYDAIQLADLLAMPCFNIKVESGKAVTVVDEE